MKKALLALAVFAAITVIAGWQSGLWSERVEVCGIDKETHEKRCSIHGAALGSLVRLGAFLEQRGEAIIAGFSAVLAISISLLWLAMHRIQKSTAALHDALHEAGQRQIAIAQQSADAATKAALAAEASVKMMTDTAQRQLRAYVSVQATLMELLEPPNVALRPSHSEEHKLDTGM